MNCIVCNSITTFEKGRLNTQEICNICKNAVCWICSRYCCNASGGCTKNCCKRCLLKRCNNEYMCVNCNSPKPLFVLAAKIINDADKIFELTRVRIK